jgi:cytochrome P450
MTALARISSDIDLFTDEALHNPYPLYKELRDLGPAAYLQQHGVYYLGRYDQVREALRDWQTFSSAQGAGLNDIINNAWKEALICLDPPKHTEMRKLITDRIGPRHLKDLQQTIHTRAGELVQRLLECRDFDAVSDVAHDLPLNVIFDLIGWPEEVRGELLEFAVGSFNSCGPDAPRMRASLPRMEAMMEFITKTYDEDRLTPGGFGATIADAARRGEIPRESAITLLAGYIVAAFDTTINAIGNGLWLFAEHPEQWRMVREDPGRVPAAFLEILRIETPLQHLARVTTREVDLGEGVVLPAGARVVLSYASANRDERHYPDPERFDIDRNPLDHLAFGLGNHTCAGQGLARLEGLAVFSALAQNVDGFTMTGPAQRDPNSVTRGFSSLPMRIQ